MSNYLTEATKFSTSGATCCLKLVGDWKYKYVLCATETPGTILCHIIWTCTSQFTHQIKVSLRQSIMIIKTFK